MKLKHSITHVADLFCGAGGTSTGLVEALEILGRDVQLTAINHWQVAISTHQANHPNARHLCASVDEVNPRHLFAPGQLEVLWASPECMSHSRARGGRPMNDQSRATAHCVTRWAEALQPNVILVENVKEFEDWGPLKTDGRPMKNRKGDTFHAWVNMLKSLGYRVDWRVLCAADYGDPTTRQRLFVQAVRGRRKIVWPNPTHDRNPSRNFLPRQPWRSAKDIIDWTIQSESIFSRKKPLAPRTLERIEAGFKKFSGLPFVLQVGHGSGLDCRIHSTDQPLGVVPTRGKHALAQPFVVELRNNATARELAEPLSTVCASGAHHALIEPFVIELDHQSRGTGGNSVASPDQPLTAVTTKARHCLVEPFLIEYYGSANAGQSVHEPLPTVTTRDRQGLVQPIIKTADGKTYLVDIHFRMLQPRELAAAQGFRADYIFTGNKTETVKQIGNAVPRNLSRAIALAALSQSPDISSHRKH